MEPYKLPKTTASSDERSMAVRTKNSTSSSSASGQRLKRESRRRIPQDSHFSSWQIIIGSSDWEKHKKGEEGAERYRTQNLPNSASSPGIYELGLVKSGTKARKPYQKSVIPVYVGQADNVRTRLQQYGRDGAHLENGCSSDCVADCTTVSFPKKLGLFSDTFSRGYDIVYRFCPLETKKNAEIAEKQLLGKHDYAWNKDQNGVRRIEDIHRIMDRREKDTKLLSLLKLGKLLLKPRRRVDIEFKTDKPFSQKDESSLNNKVKKVSSTFGIKRLQTLRAEYGSDICGVTIGHGSVCTTPPVMGRKRCLEHKGMRVNGYHSSSTNDRKTPSVSEKMGSGVVADPQDGCFPEERMSHGQVEHQPHKCEESTNEYFAPICGVILDNGSPCRRKPFSKNKRCLMHKGRRIRH